jgi:hypothetical protein
VTTVYLLAPGTRVSVSRNGGEFKPHMLRRQLQFSKPLLTTDADVIFAKGSWRVLVDRSQVIISRYNGQGGWNQFWDVMAMKRGVATKKAWQPANLAAPHSAA